MTFVLAVPAALLFAGCKKSEPSGAAKVEAALPAAAVAEAKTIFTQRCTPCHGTSGKGDGPASAALSPKPRNFADAAWQKEVSDDHLEKIIVGGGAAVGRSPAMPANPDLDGKADVVKALRAHIRSLKQ